MTQQTLITVAAVGIGVALTGGLGLIPVAAGLTLGGGWGWIKG